MSCMQDITFEFPCTCSKTWRYLFLKATSCSHMPPLSLLPCKYLFTEQQKCYCPVQIYSAVANFTCLSMIFQIIISKSFKQRQPEWIQKAVFKWFLGEKLTVWPHLKKNKSNKYSLNLKTYACLDSNIFYCTFLITGRESSATLWRTFGHFSKLFKFFEHKQPL